MIDLEQCAEDVKESAVASLRMALDAQQEGKHDKASEHFADARSLSMEQAHFIIGAAIVERLYVQGIAVSTDEFFASGGD